jgi:hypothetical protein
LEPATVRSLGRNDPCHCGSGRKYKQCCLTKDEAAERLARVKAAEEAPATAGAAAPAAPPAAPRHTTAQPWKKGAANTRGFQRVNATRKVGGG